MRIRSAFRAWLPVALAVTLTLGVVYVVAQQVYRTSANDPQQWMADDLLARLASGEDPGALVEAPTVDITKTSAPFVVVYDDSRTPLAWSASQDGRAPHPPEGVLKTAQKSGRDAVTWQTASGHRFATITVADEDRVVFAARSLVEPERRIAALGRGVLAGWAITMLATFAGAVLASPRRGTVSA